MEEIRIDVRKQHKERESMYQLLIKEVELAIGNKLQEMLKELPPGSTQARKVTRNTKGRHH